MSCNGFTAECQGLGSNELHRYGIELDAHGFSAESLRLRERGSRPSERIQHGVSRLRQQTNERCRDLGDYSTWVPMDRGETGLAENSREIPIYLTQSEGRALIGHPVRRRYQTDTLRPDRQIHSRRQVQTHATPQAARSELDASIAEIRR